MSLVSRRKLEHLDLCANGDVESRRTTLLEEVDLLHDALPELNVDDVDCGVDLLGRRLRAPLIITGMTGGPERAQAINRSLAEVAQTLGFGMGLGSQRPMLARPELASSYRVRDVAPDVLLLANIGCVQARDIPTLAVRELVESVEADAICVHLNAAQELVQDEGDRSFTGCLDAIARLVDELPVPVVVKETGCGLSPHALRRLREVGVELVDVAGVGGTTWPGVEALRGTQRQHGMGSVLREWGIPTAASLLYANRAGMPAIASGGIRDASDAVRALALGASAVGMALPFLRAFERGGADAAHMLASGLIEAFEATMLLAGARNVADLARLPIVIGPTLRHWAEVDLDRRSGRPADDRCRLQGQQARPSS